MTQPNTIGPHLLKRHVNHDPRSRDFPAMVGPVRAVEWPVYGNPLNQGNLGSCTANALSQWLNAGPEHKGKLRTETEAKALYHQETIIQGGPVYPPADPGGSGVAVCKAGVKLGLIRGYQHAFGIAHAQGAVSVSPFIVGTNWYTAMFTPDPDGFVTIGGNVEGGHEYLCYGFDPVADVWTFRNSWGKKWGLAGSFKMRTATFAQLLAEQGDVTVPLPLTATHDEIAATTLVPLTLNAVVTEVHDGDTIRADIDRGIRLSQHDQVLGFGDRIQAHRLISNRPIRLASCNAPELATPAGPPAQVALAALVPVGSAIQLRTHLPGVPELDDYGRVLADVYPMVEGVPAAQDVSVTMIAEGYAAPWNGQGPKPVPPPRPVTTAQVEINNIPAFTLGSDEPTSSSTYTFLEQHAAPTTTAAASPAPMERVVRSLVQIVVAECVAIPSAVGALGLSAATTSKVAAIAGLIVLVVSTAQNVLEAKSGATLGLHRRSP